MSCDNVQRFEQLGRDAQFLQSIADADFRIDDDETRDTINALTKEAAHQLPEMAVSIIGGMIEVSALNGELENVNQFTPLTDEVSGMYQGIFWRQGTVEIPGEEAMATWYLCHGVAGNDITYFDDEGNRICHTPISYITTEGSSIELMTPVGSHSYVEIAMDGLCHEIDRIMFEEDMDMQQKADLLARIFTIDQNPNNKKGAIRKLRQRISYLNSTGIFENTVVITPVAIQRTAEGCSLLSSSGVFMVTVNYVANDEVVDLETLSFAGDSLTLSYEGEMEGFGSVSIPHIPGITKVYKIE